MIYHRDRKGSWRRQCSLQLVLVCSLLFRGGEMKMKRRPDASSRRATTSLWRDVPQETAQCLIVCWRHPRWRWPLSPIWPLIVIKAILFPYSLMRQDRRQTGGRQGEKSATAQWRGQFKGLEGAYQMLNICQRGEGASAGVLHFTVAHHCLNWLFPSPLSVVCPYRWQLHSTTTSLARITYLWACVLFKMIITREYHTHSSYNTIY